MVWEEPTVLTAGVRSLLLRGQDRRQLEHPPPSVQLISSIPAVDFTRALTLSLRQGPPHRHVATVPPPQPAPGPAKSPRLLPLPPPPHPFPPIHQSRHHRLHHHHRTRSLSPQRAEP
ncbi:unnamed protein product [Urochloa decumbens]|uniref:Uncharacterized protein n=1 Tax=Urochloa decumbens TaxID=240449 RepID=A0ABC9GXT8_9POAL